MMPSVSTLHPDLSLPPWGPYAKHYAGYSFIPGNGNLSMVDFVPLLGHDRGRIIVPDLHVDSGYQVTAISSDLGYIRYRFLLRGGTAEFAEMEFVRTESGMLGCIHFVNHSSSDKVYVASMMSVCRPLPRRVSDSPSGAFWIGAERYARLTMGSREVEWARGNHYEGNNTQAQIHLGKDGYRCGVVSGSFLVDGLGLGNCEDPERGAMGLDNRYFVFRPGTRIDFTLPPRRGDWRLFARCWRGTVVHMELRLHGAGGSSCCRIEPDAREWDLEAEWFELPLDGIAGETLGIEVVAVETEGAPQFILDGLLWLPGTGPGPDPASFVRASSPETPSWRPRRATPVSAWRW